MKMSQQQFQHAICTKEPQDNTGDLIYNSLQGYKTADNSLTWQQLFLKWFPLSRQITAATISQTGMPIGHVTVHNKQCQNSHLSRKQPQQWLTQPWLHFHPTEQFLILPDSRFQTHPSSKAITCTFVFNSIICELEALTNLLHQIDVLNPTIMLYPWKSMDHNSKPAIWLSTKLLEFFNIPTNSPGFASFKQLDNPTHHPFVFLAFSKPLAVLVQTLSPWLQATKQGLWPYQLPLVEQTSCLGWFLFSAPEYHLDELRRTILTTTGVKVALRY